MRLVHTRQFLQVCIRHVKHVRLGRGLVGATLAPVASWVPARVTDSILGVDRRRDSRLRPPLLLALDESLHLNLN